MSKRILFITAIVLASISWLAFGHGSETNLWAVSRDLQPPLDTSPADNHSTSDLSQEELEGQILASTVRIKIRTWIMYVEGEGYTSLFSMSHGTVIDGRYLLTHNHFQLPLLELLGGDPNGEFATIELLSYEGDLIWKGSLTTAGVVYDDSETLLLELVDQEGRGLFESLGIPSAAYAPPGTMANSEGVTVAQVNWDREKAFVQWTDVKALSAPGGTPVVKLNGCLIPGASGGGVFVNGVHIANNWYRSEGCTQGAEDGNLLFSSAALNSAELLAAIR